MVGGLLQAGGSPWVTPPRKGGFSVSQGTWKWGHLSVLLSHLFFPENVILGDFSREFLVFNCVWDVVRLVRAAELSQHPSLCSPVPLAALCSKVSTTAPANGSGQERAAALVLCWHNLS